MQRLETTITGDLRQTLSDMGNRIQSLTDHVDRSPQCYSPLAVTQPSVCPPVAATLTGGAQLPFPLQSSAAQAAHCLPMTTPSAAPRSTNIESPLQPPCQVSHAPKTTAGRMPPTKGLVIPDVPVKHPDGTKTPKEEAWRDIIRHWTKGEPHLGLARPLRDWSPSDLRGSNRPLKAKHHNCGVIATEFLDHYGGDKAAFVQAYQTAIRRGHHQLLKAIEAVRVQCGTIIKCGPYRQHRQHRQQSASSVVSPVAA